MSSEVNAKNLNSQSLRACFGEFVTGVTIITALGHDQKPIGLTVNSFVSLSLNPPLISWCLSHASQNQHAFTVAPYFAVNILSAAQLSLAQRFSSKVDDRFAHVAWHLATHAVPLLDDCCAHLICKTVEQLDRGDHSIFIGEVVSHQVFADRLPLIFHRGQLRSL